jgi:hypothetical protein
MDNNENIQNPPVPPNSQKWAYWEKGGQHAQMLFRMIYNKTIPNGWKPNDIVKEFPQYAVYKPENFRSTVSRYRRRIESLRRNGERLVAVQPGLPPDGLLSSNIGT